MQPPPDATDWRVAPHVVSEQQPDRPAQPTQRYKVVLDLGFQDLGFRSVSPRKSLTTITWMQPPISKRKHASQEALSQAEQDGLRAPEHAAQDGGSPQRGRYINRLQRVAAGQQAVMLQRRGEHRAARRVGRRQCRLAAGPGRLVAPARCKQAPQREARPPYRVSISCLHVGSTPTQSIATFCMLSFCTGAAADRFASCRTALACFRHASTGADART